MSAPTLDYRDLPLIVGTRLAARFLGYSQRQIQIWCKQGKFNGANELSCGWVIHRDAVVRFRELRRQANSPLRSRL